MARTAATEPENIRRTERDKTVSIIINKHSKENRIQPNHAEIADQTRLFINKVITKGAHVIIWGSCLSNIIAIFDVQKQQFV
jgi:hypothetical protein